jgi:hypothetical protein
MIWSDAMIDEIAEVKRYLSGEGLEDSRNYYRACYMIAKYYKKIGKSKSDAFQKISAWVRDHALTLPFPLIACVSTAWENETPLRCGTTVKISQADADVIRLYSRNRQDRKTALALMCCAKAFAEKDGSFTASSSALASWLGMDSANLRQRQLKHLQEYGFIEKAESDDAMHGWKKNYYRNACRFRLLVQYTSSGKWELVHNDIRNLYEQIFGEPYDVPKKAGA